MSGQRAAGSRDIPRATIACTLAGTFVPAGDFGAPRSFSAPSSVMLRAVKAGLRYSASHSATQNPYWSVRASTGSPRCCSGAM